MSATIPSAEPVPPATPVPDEAAPVATPAADETAPLKTPAPVEPLHPAAPHDTALSAATAIVAAKMEKAKSEFPELAEHGIMNLFDEMYRDLLLLGKRVTGRV